MTNLDGSIIVCVCVCVCVNVKRSHFKRLRSQEQGNIRETGCLAINDHTVTLWRETLKTYSGHVGRLLWIQFETCMRECGDGVGVRWAAREGCG